MEYKKVRLGDYLLGYDEINKDGEFSEIDDLQGINNEKYFQGCQSNKNDIDLNRYRICRHGMFAYNKATSRNGEKISIAYRTDGDCLISPSYICFSIKDENVLMPEYLMLWFKRPEFDRYARFNSWGSATEFFTWEDFQDIEFDLPPIEEQQKIVRQYKTITDRIGVLEKINERLRQFASLYFKKNVRNVETEEYFESEIGNYPVTWQIKELGEVIETILDRRGVTPLKLGSDWSDEGIIALSAKSVKNHKLVNLDQVNYVDEKLYKKWMKEELNSQDILMTSEAPLGEFYYLADFCHYCLSQRLFAIRAKKEIIEPSLLYFQLSDSVGKSQITMRESGSTVTGIRQTELVKIPVVVPDKDVQKDFALICDSLLLNIEKNSNEIRKLEELLVHIEYCVA